MLGVPLIPVLRFGRLQAEYERFQANTKERVTTLGNRIFFLNNKQLFVILKILVIKNTNSVIIFQ